LLEITDNLSYIPYAGWDVIVTDNEGSFKLIEANSHSGVKSLQVHEPLLVDNRVREFYETYGVTG
jgi:D-alanine-D-alanine ligase-like ATP-grasp enzyme